MVDELDLRLVSELQTNGREAFVILGEKLGISEGTVRKRFKGLIDDDIISVAALPNLRKLGLGVVGIVAFQVRMDELEKAAEALTQDERVCYLTLVAGRYDLVAVVIARSTEDLSDFIEGKNRPSAGIVRSETFVALRSFKGSIPAMDTLQLIAGLRSGSRQ